MEDGTAAGLLAYRQPLQQPADSLQKRYLAAIKAFFGWALDAGIIVKKLAASMQLPKRVRKKTLVFFFVDETRLLLNTAKLSRYIVLPRCHA